MASNENGKKISHRLKKSNNEKLGIHSIPEEVVEIERNIIENWLISLKHWLHINPSTARKIILGVLVSAVVFFMFIFIHSAVIEKQNSNYYSILMSYEKLKGENNENKIDDKKIKKLMEHSHKLCNSLWQTRYSNNGCLLSAILSNEAGNKKDTADFLAKFAAKSHDQALAAYTTFISGYFYEASQDLEHSLELYKKLDKYVDDKNGKDFVLFHKGRLFYYNNKFTEAESSFKEIIEKYKTSNYYKDAKNYLLLVQMKMSEPATK